jgi:hypothetical protein
VWLNPGRQSSRWAFALLFAVCTVSSPQATPTQSASNSEEGADSNGARMLFVLQPAIYFGMPEFP